MIDQNGEPVGRVFKNAAFGHRANTIERLLGGNATCALVSSSAVANPSLDEREPSISASASGAYAVAYKARVADDWNVYSRVILSTTESCRMPQGKMEIR